MKHGSVSYKIRRFRIPIGRPEFVARNVRIVSELSAHAAEVRELADGFSYRFPSESPWVANIVEFVEGERVCCPFLRFEIALEANRDLLWLTMQGSERAKAFIVDELGLTMSAG